MLLFCRHAGYIPFGEEIKLTAMQDNERKTLDKYIVEICKEQVLTVEEEKELAAKIACGDAKSLNKLVTANLRFVVSMANKYQGQGVAIEDLVSEGNIALMKAAAKYDASRSRFVSYAVPIIRRQMEQALETQGALYKIPRAEATAGERRRSHALSVDAPLGGRENVNLLSLLVNPNAPEADAHFGEVEQSVALDEVLNRLDERERDVISGLFGIGRERLAMAELAAEMGLKRERVRQIRNKAIRKLSKLVKESDER